MRNASCRINACVCYWIAAFGAGVIGGGRKSGSVVAALRAQATLNAPSPTQRQWCGAKHPENCCVENRVHRKARPDWAERKKVDVASILRLQPRWRWETTFVLAYFGQRIVMAET